MDDQRHWAPIIIRSSIPTTKERKFLASLIVQKRKGQKITEKQADWLGAIVRRFQRETMRESANDEA